MSKKTTMKKMENILIEFITEDHGSPKEFIKIVKGAISKSGKIFDDRIKKLDIALKMLDKERKEFDKLKKKDAKVKK